MEAARFGGGGWALGLSLVREFTERWGATVEGYDLDSSGHVVYDVLLRPGTREFAIARWKAMCDENRRRVAKNSEALIRNRNGCQQARGRVDHVRRYLASHGVT